MQLFIRYTLLCALLLASLSASLAQEATPEATEAPEPAAQSTRTSVFPLTLSSDVGESRNLVTLVEFDEDVQQHIIFEVDPTTQQRTDLATSEGVIFPAPAWGVDGNTLAFIKDGVHLTIWRSGTERRILTLEDDTDCERLFWSVDNRNIYCDNPADRRYTGYILDTLTGEQRRLFDINNVQGISSNPWSPDGTKILTIIDAPQFSALSGFGVYEAATGEVTVYPRPDFVEDATWLPLGEILYLTDKSVVGIYVPEIDLAEEIDVKDTIDRISLSPTGSELAYRALDRDIPQQLYITNIAGSDPRQFTSFTASIVESFSWSPDGQWMLLSAVSSTTGVVVYYIIPLEPSRETIVLQAATNVNRGQPLWRP